MKTLVIMAMLVLITSTATAHVELDYGLIYEIHTQPGATEHYRHVIDLYQSGKMSNEQTTAVNKELARKAKQNP